ncbi:MAG: hypothetical protein V4615_05095 [Bacteroidota bacterium]
MSYTTDYIINNDIDPLFVDDSDAPASTTLLSVEVPAQVNKTTVRQYAQNIIDNAIEDNRVLKTAEGLAVMEKLVKAVREETRFVDAVVDELTLNNKVLTTPNGTLIEVTEVGVKYDYSHDEEWRNIKAEIDQQTLLLKQREAVLKIARDGAEKVDENTGEVVIGANRKSKTSYKITLAK